MEILTSLQVHLLFNFYKRNLTSIKDNPDNKSIDTWILNIGLTFNEDSRRQLHTEYQGFEKTYHRFMLKLARANKCHVFGWLGMGNELTGNRPHAHILTMMKFDHLRPDVSDLLIDDLWKYSDKPVDIKLWDGVETVLFYNYSTTVKRNSFGDVDSHYHYMKPTTVYHPRRTVCRQGNCETCKFFPPPSEFGVK
jgi:hypothetical protein